VDAVLDALLTAPAGPYVARLPREPRRKDHAWAHLFSGSIESAPPSPEPVESAQPARVSSSIAPNPDALAALEARVATLEHALAEIRRSLGIA
jgi:uncharacterized protein YceH (UPF0502 family)